MNVDTNKKRPYLLTAAWALALMLLGSHIVLRYWFISDQPMTPNPAAGRIVPVDEHGARYYITTEEGRILDVLEYSGIIFLAAGIIASWRQRKVSP